MPFGPTAVGVTYFTGVKLAGYSLAGFYVNRREATARPRPLLFGVARTVLGVAAGVSYGFAMSQVRITNSEVAFYAGLLPVRVLEWWFILWLFYRGLPQIRTRAWRYVALGCGWSYVLDLPAITAAFVLPGGFWVC